MRWLPAPLSLPALSEDEVILWRASLREPPPLDTLLRDSALDDAERARARRYLRPEHGQRWALARHAARTIIASYCAIPPESLTFIEAERGKLSVREAPWLSFNLSHSGDWLLLALTLAPAQLGVDVEQARPDRHFEVIARRVFSPREQRALLALADDAAAYRACFYRIWTRKEAYIKALGMGLHLPLESFDVSPEAHSRPPLLEARHEGALDASRWHMFSDEVSADHPLALCLDRPFRTPDVGYELARL